MSNETTEYNIADDYEIVMSGDEVSGDEVSDDESESPPVIPPKLTKKGKPRKQRAPMSDEQKQKLKEGQRLYHEQRRKWKVEHPGEPFPKKPKKEKLTKEQRAELARNAYETRKEAMAQGRQKLKEERKQGVKPPRISVKHTEETKQKISDGKIKKTIDVKIQNASKMLEFLNNKKKKWTEPESEEDDDDEEEEEVPAIGQPQFVSEGEALKHPTERDIMVEPQVVKATGKVVADEPTPTPLPTPKKEPIQPKVVTHVGGATTHVGKPNLFERATFRRNTRRTFESKIVNGRKVFIL